MSLPWPLPHNDDVVHRHVHAGNSLHAIWGEDDNWGKIWDDDPKDNINTTTTGTIDIGIGMDEPSQQTPPQQQQILPQQQQQQQSSDDSGNSTIPSYGGLGLEDVWCHDKSSSSSSSNRRKHHKLLPMADIYFNGTKLLARLDDIKKKSLTDLVKCIFLIAVLNTFDPVNRPRPHDNGSIPVFCPDHRWTSSDRVATRRGDSHPHNSTHFYERRQWWRRRRRRTVATENCYARFFDEYHYWRIKNKIRNEMKWNK